MTPKTQNALLKAGAALVMVSGVIIGLGAMPATNLPARLVADVLIWPFDGAQTGAASETRLLCAIGGGVMLGWGYLLWQMIALGLAPALIFRSVLVWFVADSAMSVAAGVPLNLLGNAVFLILFSLPFLGRSKAASAA